MIKHIFLDDKRYDSILNSIRATYPNSCIIEIKEVINDDDRVQVFLKNYEKELNLKESTKLIELFHGTDENSSYNIIDEGFLISRNKISAYGKGTYFSNSADIAKSYALSRGNKKSQNNLLYVIIADVIVSDMQLGSPPSLVSSASSASSVSPSVSCYVNNVDHPSYFCIPHDNRALPKYIVSFYEQ
jgi:hypothetical protein